MPADRVKRGGLFSDPYNFNSSSRIHIGEAKGEVRVACRYRQRFALGGGCKPARFASRMEFSI